MMNDMMPTIEETITPDIAAQIEHEEWQRVLLKWEQRERWEAVEALHGPLHHHAYAGYEGMGWKD